MVDDQHSEADHPGEEGGLLCSIRTTVVSRGHENSGHGICEVVTKLHKLLLLSTGYIRHSITHPQMF